MNYLVAGRQPWNRRHYSQFFSLEHEWDFCSDAKELQSKIDLQIPYRYIFFLHWSEKIPESIIAKYDCVCFHMTDVPFGRGGSPLQNLIQRGIRETKLSALKMTSEFDAGPVYMKRPLSLEGGTAEEIYQRASRLSCKMAREIAVNEPKAIPQTGNVTEFKRRRPADSKLPLDQDLEKLFDHIRMLDADGYPHGFIRVGNYRFEFRRAAMYDNKISSDVQITFIGESE